MNSVSPTTPNVNVTTFTKPDSELTIARQLLWQVGFDAFCEGRGYFDMLTTDERAGWISALNTCANAETNAYLVAKGVAR